MTDGMCRDCWLQDCHVDGTRSNGTRCTCTCHNPPSGAGSRLGDTDYG